MRVGDVVETAIWLDGRESKEQRSAFEREVTDVIDLTCQNNGFIHGEVRFTLKHPYDDRVPEVPEHIKGTQARLLVAEADIIAKAIESRSTFISNLEKKDLQALRKITKQVYLKKGHLLNDGQADQVIEILGPETAYDMLSGKSN